jgi:hypothetical protein
MNVLLRDTEEYIDGKHTGTLGLVLIRCVQTPLGYFMGNWPAEMVLNSGLLTLVVSLTGVTTSFGWARQMVWK